MLSPVRPTRYCLAAASSALVLLATTGCLRKEDIESCPGQCTVVNGRLLTSGQQPLAEAPVSIRWELRRGIIGGELRTRGRTTTDANGNFHFSFYAKDDELQSGYYSVAYEVDKNRYYVLDNTGGLLNIKRDTTYQLAPFLIPRKAAVHLTVPNPDQIQGYFAVDFTGAYGQTLVTTRGLGGGPVIIVPKQSSPYASTVEVAGDQKLYMQVTRDLGGVTTHILDSLVVTAGTTRNLTVRY